MNFYSYEIYDLQNLYELKMSHISEKYLIPPYKLVYIFHVDKKIKEKF